MLIKAGTYLRINRANLTLIVVKVALLRKTLSVSSLITFYAEKFARFYTQLLIEIPGDGFVDKA
jgi:hypothetical protein